MQPNDKIQINGQTYEAHSFNTEINSNKKTGRVDPCTMCALDSFNDMKLCETIECINGNEFMYLKLIK